MQKNGRLCPVGYCAASFFNSESPSHLHHEIPSPHRIYLQRPAHDRCGISSMDLQGASGLRRKQQEGD